MLCLCYELYNFVIKLYNLTDEDIKKINVNKDLANQIAQGIHASTFKIEALKESMQKS